MTSGTGRADSELIHRIVAGDRASFDELMRRHEDRVFAICLRVMGNREAALDAAQETFITVFRKLHLFSGAAAFTTWLYRVTMNTCYDQLRRARRHRSEPLPEGSEPVALHAADEFEAVDARPEIEQALSRLPVEFRAAVILSDMEGLPLQDVADALAVPLGTVKSRVFRARRLLAAALGNLTGPSPHPTGDHDA